MFVGLISVHIISRYNVPCKHGSVCRFNSAVENNVSDLFDSWISGIFWKRFDRDAPYLTQPEGRCWVKCPACTALSRSVDVCNEAILQLTG